MPFFLRGNQAKRSRGGGGGGAWRGGRRAPPSAGDDESKAKEKAPSRGRKRRAVEEVESESSGEEGAAAPPPSDSNSDGEESAPQKRLRIAKPLLEQIERQATLHADDDAADASIDDGAKEEVRNQWGKLHRPVAESVLPPDPTSFAWMHGHRFPATCVALNSAATVAVSGAKDGALIKWNLEDGSKQSVKGWGKKDKRVTDGHTGEVLAVAISDDDQLLCSAGTDRTLKVWQLADLKLIKSFSASHQAAVTGLAFRLKSRQLFSCSRDKCVKVWDLEQMGYVDAMFGHADAVAAVDALSRERCVSAGGADRSLRIWKVIDESQLVFNGHPNCSSIDCVRLINEDHFISGAMDGGLSVWSTFKKKPLCTRRAAHGALNGETCWILSVASHRYTDCIATGSRDGFIRVWKLAPDYRRLDEMFAIPMAGCVNDLRFSSDGSVLVCAVGKEAKFGRYWKHDEAKNSVVVIRLLTKSAD